MTVFRVNQEAANQVSVGHRTYTVSNGCVELLEQDPSERYREERALLACGLVTAVEAKEEKPVPAKAAPKNSKEAAE